MFAESWFYDFIIYVYALSLLFAFSDLMQPSRSSRRLALSFLMAVWFFQTVFFAWRTTEEFPRLAGLDSLLFYSWVLVTGTLVINRLYRMDFFVFAANLLGFGFLASNLYLSPEAASPLTEPLLSELVFVHVTLAFLAYAFFSLSTVCAVLYLVGDYLLKRKQWNRTLRRLPSLGSLQLFSYRLNMLGVPLLMLAMILGIVWAYEKVGGDFWYDPKIFGSFIVLAAYSVYLYQRVARGWNGRRLAWWGVISFFTVMVNYLISNAGLSFHQWL
ncbi:HemX family protein [Melghirimyces profundicolus]|uniref:HemX family protein n=1 Tax=Melghirimyces profundicolus TaxID=1242148 RepID=A0A2T6BTG7_9BACL|nr:cytochrome c biogenesis protein CcsA [Melghirimyces profundicolus]PTX59371.1 HemX family protein [Melghirimyces profundicolus]